MMISIVISRTWAMANQMGSLIGHRVRCPGGGEGRLRGGGSWPVRGGAIPAR